MSAHAGLDRLSYPGEPMMQKLWDSTNLSWTGFYLAPAPSQKHAGWMTKRQVLREMGWGFAPIYVGQQPEHVGGHVSKILTADQGKKDAAQAAMLARTAGFPGRSVIYLDNEAGDLPSKGYQAYYSAWTQGIFDNGYYPGIYCSFLIAQALAKIDARSVTWVFRVRHKNKHFKDEVPLLDLGKSGYYASSMWQFAHASSLSFKDDKGKAQTLNDVDFNTSDSTDPSNFLNLTAGF